MIDLTNYHTDPGRNPHLHTPNRHIIAGTMRWGIVETCLAEGCTLGRIKGITPQWMPLTPGAATGPHVLELVGKHTCVTAFHLTDPDEAPRDSNHRAEQRLFNQANPLLPGFVDHDLDADTLLNLLLVHGDKDAEFAYLRAYHKPDKVGAFLPVIPDNIMQLTAQTVPAAEAESIVEAEVKLQPTLHPKRADAER